MDDSLEQPDADLKKVLFTDSGEPFEKEDEGQSSGDEEDGGLDWTNLPLGVSISRPVIPRRGDKEYEPHTAGAKGEGSNLQKHALDRARGAMFDALRATRNISSKSISYGVWYPDIARVHVTLARGTHFSNIGHSVPRPTLISNINGVSSPAIGKLQKRLELLPEEALYLVERGTMFCWKEHDLFSGIPGEPNLEEMEGSPMSVQQAFSEMIGKEDLTLEKYQVYSYLKRLGYVVTRTKPPTDSYPMPPPYPLSSKTVQSAGSVFKRILSALKNYFSRVLLLFAPRFDWWKPLRINRWLGINMDYRSIFRSLRFIRNGHDIPLNVRSEPSSPYYFFFNLYKPSTPYKKTSPPIPDFTVSVINARTTPMPSIAELTEMFDILPELPPPLPRQRPKLQQTESSPSAPVSGRQSFKPRNAATLSERIWSWTRWPSSRISDNPRKPHPFVAIKAGRKSAIVAVVDAGTPSFFRFGQGAFDMWPMYESLPNRDF